MSDEIDTHHPPKDEFDDYPYAAFVSGDEEKNELFHRADEANMPFMAIKEKQRYGRVEVDFITTESDGLDDQAAERADALGNEYFGRAMRLAKPHQRSNIRLYGPAYFIGLTGAPINLGREYALKLAAIVFDQSNWSYRHRTPPAERGEPDEQLEVSDR